MLRNLASQLLNPFYQDVECLLNSYPNFMVIGLFKKKSLNLSKLWDRANCMKITIGVLIMTTNPFQFKKEKKKMTVNFEIKSFF